MRAAIAVIALLVLPALAPRTEAAGLVTACAFDNQVGAGKNFRDAMAGGGTVTFNCPAGSVMRLTQEYSLAAPVSILGGNRVTLDAQGANMFKTSIENLHVEIRDITLRNARRFPLGLFGFIYSGSMVQGPIDLDLEHVTIRDSHHPIDVRNAVIADSTFVGIQHVVMRAATVVAVRTSFNCPETSLPFAFRGTQSLTFDHVTVNGCGRIWAVGDTLIRDSEIINNLEKYPQLPGGTMSIVGGNVRIEKTSFTGNRANQGGAIYMTHGSLSLRRVRFLTNRATGPAPPYSNADVKLELRYVRFIQNQAAVGGAIALHEGANNRTATVTGDALLFQANTASDSGGAVYIERGGLSFGRPIFVDNRAQTGGAVFGGPRAVVQLANGLMIRNIANEGSAFAGAALRLSNATVSDNRGLALAWPGAAGAGSVTIKNSIVSRNTGGNCAPAPAPDVIVDAGNNIQFPDASCGAGIRTVDPLLDEFYAPSPLSLARNAGDNAACEAAPVFARDVYGEHRPRAERCTIGAVEGDASRFALARLRDTPLTRLNEDLAEMKDFIWGKDTGREDRQPTSAR